MLKPTACEDCWIPVSRGRKDTGRKVIGGTRTCHYGRCGAPKTPSTSHHASTQASTSTSILIYRPYCHFTTGNMARKKTGPPLKRGRKPTKPPKALKARTAYLSSLPAETLGLIASFLLPATTSLTLGFPSPHDRPYTSERTVTTMGKTERYGGIPGGIRDLTSFAQTCKNARRGVDLVVGRIGGIGKTGAIARPGMR